MKQFFIIAIRASVRLAGHAIAQAVPTNARDRFHERARGVSQEHPVDRKVDVGLQAGRVDAGVGKIHR
jgi:hypothetical protein